ncbi:hypothetical protein GCM10009557_03810 [Virgisporangium ochraceum]|uniref:Uncharacterized protein n=2 Tax=Virgisporangium ochraceum TaxID=65505 RepID=A0A8J4A3M1_9ACTN|nr:hypothetical protein Voc01_076570 [Virgisporangium ochraceum]
MDVFLYFPPSSGVAWGDLDDVIDDVLGERGETTGGGLGNRGGNVDIELSDDADGERTLGDVGRLERRAFRNLRPAAITKLRAFGPDGFVDREIGGGGPGAAFTAPGPP